MTDTPATPPAARTTPGLDPRPVFARAVAIGADVVAGIRPDQLEVPTPCREYDVRTLVGHVLSVYERLVLVGRGEDPMSGPDIVEGIADDGWSQAYAAVAERARAAWEDDDLLTRTIVLPWAELPGAEILAGYVSEITVHTWDLATATGQRPAWDPESLAVADRAIRAMLPAENREWAPFDEVVEVPADAPAIDRLVAWNGRRP